MKEKQEKQQQWERKQAEKLQKVNQFVLPANLMILQ